ncbi:class I SAM-dependent methyltransferase [Planococcus halotolerans]|uniref:class I SAM-dependent methyltransferase n=1 Tax=Planococcus halotolerans TaxID=2233542 RepID=UPI001F315068|nr:class I SAM-dependent methyltransferase [Planococcus halotolerans]
MLSDPRKHPEWLEPHSLKWYQQLGDKYQAYSYPWTSTIETPNGESIYDDELYQMVRDKKVLDVGCGHGEFALHCSSAADKVVGFDVIDSFLKSGMQKPRENLEFVLGNTKEGLPFGRDEFDVAYIRKGPTSAYPHLKRVVKENGQVLGLHPGDASGKELADYFPGLFEFSPRTPILEKINRILVGCSFSKTEIEIYETVEYLHASMDVIRFCCFGQTLNVFSAVERENLSAIEGIFKREAAEKGLAITHSRYIVRVTV